MELHRRQQLHQKYCLLLTQIIVDEAGKYIDKDYGRQYNHMKYDYKLSSKEKEKLRKSIAVNLPSPAKLRRYIARKIAEGEDCESKDADSDSYSDSSFVEM